MTPRGRCRAAPLRVTRGALAAAALVLVVGVAGSPLPTAPSDYASADAFPSFFAALAAAAPAPARASSPPARVGSSVEGRPLELFEAGAPGAPALLLTGLLHGREAAGAMVNAAFARRLVARLAAGDAAAGFLARARRLLVLPVVDPDAYAWNVARGPAAGPRGMARKNRAPGCAEGGGSASTGVDLNRNFPFEWHADDRGSSPDACAEDFRGPAPLSEPEARALVELLRPGARGENVTVALNWHSFGRFVNVPFSVESRPSPPPAVYAALLALARAVAAAMGPAFRFGHPFAGGLYTVNGEASDWMVDAHGVLAFSPELGPNYSDSMSNDDFARGMWPAPGPGLDAIIAEGVEGADAAMWAAGANARLAAAAVRRATPAEEDAAGVARGAGGALVGVRVANEGARPPAGTLRVSVLSLAAAAAAGGERACATRAGEGEGAGGSLCAAPSLAAALAAATAPPAGAGPACVVDEVDPRLAPPAAGAAAARRRSAAASGAAAGATSVDAAAHARPLVSPAAAAAARAAALAAAAAAAPASAAAGDRRSLPGGRVSVGDALAAAEAAAAAAAAGPAAARRAADAAPGGDAVVFTAGAQLGGAVVDIPASALPPWSSLALPSGVANATFAFPAGGSGAVCDGGDGGAALVALTDDEACSVWRVPCGGPPAPPALLLRGHSGCMPCAALRRLLLPPAAAPTPTAAAAASRTPREPPSQTPAAATAAAAAATTTAAAAAAAATANATASPAAPTARPAGSPLASPADGNDAAWRDTTLPRATVRAGGPAGAGGAGGAWPWALDGRTPPTEQLAWVLGGAAVGAAALAIAVRRARARAGVAYVALPDPFPGDDDGDDGDADDFDLEGAGAGAGAGAGTSAGAGVGRRSHEAARAAGAPTRA